MTLSQEKESIQKDARIIQASVKWWENRIERCFEEMAQLEDEAWLPDYEEQFHALLKEAEFLTHRANLECDNISRVEAKLDKYFEREKMIKNSKNMLKIVVTRKKTT